MEDESIKLRKGVWKNSTYKCRYLFELYYLYVGFTRYSTLAENRMRKTNINTGGGKLSKRTHEWTMTVHIHSFFIRVSRDVRHHSFSCPWNSCTVFGKIFLPCGLPIQKPKHIFPFFIASTASWRANVLIIWCSKKKRGKRFAWVGIIRLATGLGGPVPLKQGLTENGDISKKGNNRLKRPL